MTPHQLNRLLYLFGSLRDEILTEEEFTELNHLLSENDDARQWYLEYIYLCTDLCNLQAAAKMDADCCEKQIDASAETVTPEPGLTLEMLRALGDYERKAKTVELPKPVEIQPIMKKAAVTRPPRKLSRASILSFAASLAAVLFLVAYVHLVPRPSYEVATLLNAVDAQWSTHLPLQKGTRLSASSADSIQLKAGVIEIATDKDVTITIEAPAEFSFLSFDEILINYGRLYASVEPAGNGFSVRTLNSKIIDLGTNFGVFADTHGDTELHVFNGNTILIAGNKGQNKKTVEVSAGQARRVDSLESRITDITLNQNLFTQGIDPDTGLLITGGKQINLANIVGGGNGSTSGHKNRGIHWDGTRTVSNLNPLSVDSGPFPTGYVPVTCNPLIDGIFVPNCKAQEPLKLTSDISTLNLDEFIAADTNRQVTLILVLEEADDNAMYWFYSKEAAENNPDKYPTLVFPNALATGPEQITTADLNGADAYVSNDRLRAPKTRLGQASILACRYRQGQEKRARVIYLRFDLRDVQGDLTNATLSLYLNYGTRDRNLKVYGLKDGPAENWDETTICFETAPGLLPAAFGDYRLDDNAVDLLGTFHVVDNRIQADPIQVASDKSCAWNAPNTQCRTASIISNAGSYLDRNNSAHMFMLGGTVCGTDANPSIFIHANAGITLDLEAIRQVYGPVRMESFTAVCGISKPHSTEFGTASPSASFYVLVDGREAFSAIDMSPQDPPEAIDIALPTQARYLTLIATQGTDNSIVNDICLYAKPMITLK